MQIVQTIAYCGKEPPRDCAVMGIFAMRKELGYTPAFLLKALSYFPKDRRLLPYSLRGKYGHSRDGLIDPLYIIAADNMEDDMPTFDWKTIIPGWYLVRYMGTQVCCFLITND